MAAAVQVHVDTFQSRYIAGIGRTGVGVIAVHIALTAPADGRKRTFVANTRVGRTQVVVVTLCR